jgi:hypothetical protein
MSPFDLFPQALITNRSPDNASITSLPESFFQLQQPAVLEASASPLEDRAQSLQPSPPAQLDLESKPSPRRGRSRPKSRSIPPMPPTPDTLPEKPDNSESHFVEQPRPLIPEVSPEPELLDAEVSESSTSMQAGVDRIPKSEDEEVVPPTPTPEFYDSRHVTPQNAPTVTAAQDLPEEREHDFPPEENMGLLDTMDLPSPSSEEPEPNSPRTPSPLPSVLMTIPSSSSRPTIRAPSPVHDLAFNFDEELVLESSQNA